MPVQLAYKTLTSVLIGYATVDKEAVAVIFGIEMFREILLDLKIELRIIHEPLCMRLGVKTLCQLIAYPITYGKCKSLTWHIRLLT